jgi:hypothetical protein
MSVDQLMHALFGVSKTAADLPPRRFHDDYPAWTCRHTLHQTLEEIHDACR